MIVLSAVPGRSDTRDIDSAHCAVSVPRCHLSEAARLQLEAVVYFVGFFVYYAKQSDGQVSSICVGVAAVLSRKTAAWRLHQTTASIEPGATFSRACCESMHYAGSVVLLDHPSKKQKKHCVCILRCS